MSTRRLTVGQALGELFAAFAVVGAAILSASG